MSAITPYYQGGRKLTFFIQRLGQVCEEYRLASMQASIYIAATNLIFVRSRYLYAELTQHCWSVALPEFIIKVCKQYNNRYFINKTQQMRKSPIKNTPQKSRANSKSKGSPQPAHNSGNGTLYFCHYKNSMYMGGVKSFKKEGKGILLHDNGISLLSSYYNDLLHGHNIFFSQHCLVSADFVKNKLVEAVYRTDGFLLMVSYGAEGLLEGKSILLNYITKGIVYTTFKKGGMVDKSQETDFAVLNRVFDLGETDFLIGRMHSRALKYDIQKIPNIQVQKYGNKLTVGFQKNGLVNGLGFTIIFRGSHGGYNPDTHRNEDQFELKVVERGYFSNSQLNGFGQKWFKNGNLYIGQFKNAIFEGNGVLKNTTKKNWVSGFFEKGNLVDLLEYNNEGQQKKYDKIIQALHERKTNWINHDIALPSIDIFDGQIQKILSTVPNNQVKTLEQRKQEVLKKIQENFICEVSNLSTSVLQTNRNIEDINILSANSQERENTKKFVRNFIPDNNSAKARFKGQDMENQMSARKDNYKLASSRRNSSIRKSRIFQKGNNSLSVDSLVRNQKYEKNSTNRKGGARSPERKKLFNDNTGSSTQPRFRQGQQVRQFRQDQAESGNPNQMGNSRRSKGLGQSSINNGTIERGQGFNSGVLDSKRMIGKSKIFKYLQSQSDQITPKFSYTQVDTMREAQKKKRLGIQQDP